MDLARQIHAALLKVGLERSAKFLEQEDARGLTVRVADYPELEWMVSRGAQGLVGYAILGGSGIAASALRVEDLRDTGLGEVVVEVVA